jgi:prepilin-type N-terminal cleavage/methylation domain-containing protein
MNILNQPKKGALRSGSRNQSVIQNCRGFTLIELLVATSTVAVLIALLLPVIQSKREEYAANKAAQNIAAMLAASDEYLRRMGSYPNSISTLFQFCGANPGSCSLDPKLATGSAGGYNVIMANTEGDFHITAEPEVPGITGSETLTIDQRGMITRMPTPGSDEARQRAFNNILVSGANSVVQLLALDSNAASQVGSYSESPSALTSDFTMLDINRDGKVSINEVSTFLTTDPNGPTYVSLKSFNDAVSRELRLDILSEQDSQNVAVTLADFDGDSDVDGADYLFSYEGLRNLTRIILPNSNDLIAKLDAAEAANANGNLNRKAKSLKQYRQLVKIGIGTALTRANANILIGISNTL